MALKSLLTIKGAAFVTAALIAAGGGYYLANKDDSNTKKDSNYPKAAKKEDGDQKDDINYDPPTTEEKARADAQKEENVQRATQDNSLSSGKKSVTPVITSTTSGNPVAVNGYVSGVFEDGGLCTATFSQAGKTVTASSQGFKNVSTTNCAPISIERTKLSNGEWQVTLGYSSATASGTSTVQTLQL